MKRAQQQISDKGGDQLHLERIFTASERLLDLVELLDPFPPVLNRPPLFVQLRDVYGSQVETVSQHSNHFAIRQSVADQSKQQLRIPTGQSNQPVAPHSKARVLRRLGHQGTLDDLIIYSVFEADDEVRARFQHPGQETKTEVTAVKQGGPVRSPLQVLRGADVRHFAVGEDQLRRDLVAPLEQDGHLRRAALLPISRPREGRQREFDQAGVDGCDAGELLTDARNL